MQAALRLAEKGLYTTDPNPRVGCVIVKDNRIVGQGWHRKAGEPHAEVLALREAGGRAKDATVFVTLEPCCHYGKTPPCTQALIDAGVRKVVAAMRDPNPLVAGKGLGQLREANIETEYGLLAEQAVALNPGFVKRMETGLPYVRSKIAMSLDGRTAMAGGESKWITDNSARADVHRLRARSSAVLTGINTVLADNASLNARLLDQTKCVEQPIRVVLDSRLRMPPSAKMLSLAGITVVFTNSTDAEKHRGLERAGLEIETVASAAGSDERRVDLNAVMANLAQRQCNEVMVEAGPTLNGALLNAGLVDELIFYMAPYLMGDAARGMFTLPALQNMADRISLSVQDIRAVGHDWRIVTKLNR
jgi:diaminohydroxyphosphoribosylaminopyrimidine deaminase/5-amino-6-(5-phosphoribosylamino)uracil reductase